MNALKVRALRWMPERGITLGQHFRVSEVEARELVECGDAEYCSPEIVPAADFEPEPIFAVLDEDQ